MAATLSLMLVTVLLAAALLALEREENVYARLRRLLFGQRAAEPRRSCSPRPRALVVTLLQLAVIRIFVALSFQPLALAAGALAFAALGTALGALAREVRVASLLAVLLALPLAFLALIRRARSARACSTRSTSSPAPSRSKPTLRALDGDGLA